MLPEKANERIANVEHDIRLIYNFINRTMNCMNYSLCGFGEKMYINEKLRSRMIHVSFLLLSVYLTAQKHVFVQHSNRRSPLFHNSFNKFCIDAK